MSVELTKAESVKQGDFVSYRTAKGNYIAEVKRVVTSGTETVVTSEGGTETIEVSEDSPVAIVSIFINNEDGTFSRSDRDVPVKVSMLRHRSEPMMKQVSQKVRTALENKVKDHNEKVGSTASKRTTLRTLIAVFERGVGAYRTNPQSVRPTVSSPDQWAYARVNSYLYALRNGRFRGGTHDTDLLPKGHPKSTKKSRFKQISKDTYKPTAGMIASARRGLKLRSEQPPSKRGGTPVGIARARDIVNGKSLSASTVLRMYSFFARHAVDERAGGWDPSDDNYPSKGFQAHLLWGGSEGKAWSKRIRDQIMEERKAKKETLKEATQMMLEKGYGYEYKDYGGEDLSDDPMTLMLMAYRSLINHPHCHHMLEPIMMLIHELQEKMVEEEQMEHEEEHRREEMMEDEGMIEIDLDREDEERYGFNYSTPSGKAQKEIVMEDGQYCVRSKTTGRSFGCYKSRPQAEARLRQIESFADSSVYSATDKELIQWHDRVHTLKTITPDMVTLHDLIEEELEDRGFAPPYTLGNSEAKLAMLEKMEGSLPVVKQAEQRFTLGPVYVPNMEDAHKEFTDENTLQKALWKWVRKGDRRIYLQHSEKEAGEMVEILTFPFPIETELTVPNEGVTKYKFPANTPFMGVIWKDWAWDMVKSGELRGYSIGGQAKRMEADLPQMALV